MRRFCSSLPADRCLDKYTNSFEDLMVQRIGRKSYRIEKTGALLTYNSSLTVLAHFANSLVMLSSIFQLIFMKLMSFSNMTKI